MKNNVSKIRKAIDKVWPSIPQEFRAWHVWSAVQKAEPRLDVYQDTIMRILRMMNKQSDYGMYRSVNRRDSLYRKVDVI